MKAIIKFNPTKVFEGQEIDSIDLSGLENWSSEKYNLVVNKMRISGDYPAVGLPENSLNFAWYVGNEESGLPIEFFKNLEVKYVQAIKLVIQRNFSLTADTLAEILEISGLE